MFKRVCHLAAFMLAMWVLLTAPVAVLAEDYNCVCAGCDRPCGSGHASSCPYYQETGGGGGGDGGEQRPPVDPTRAPIFVAPVGVACGLFGGLAWYCKQMAGSNGDLSFFDSYNKFLSVEPSDEWAASSFNFGMKLGGAPWLALYLPTGPIRYGVASAYGAATRPSPPKPKPVNPNVAVYEAIASNYAGLARASEQDLQKARGDVSSASTLRTRMLDERIAASPELREIKEKEGVDAARARAEKQLDVLSRSRAERQKIALTVQQSIREQNAEIREAVNNANPASFLVDFKMDKTAGAIEDALKDKSLPKATQDSLGRQLKAANLLKNGKTVYDIGGNVTEIVKSYQKASDEGKDAAEWISDKSAREKVWRLDLKLLSVPLSGTAGLAVAATETSMDMAYAATASVVLGRRVEEQMATLDKLRTAGVFTDVQADDWDRANMVLKAAREKEEVIRKRGEQYQKMQKENERYAQTLRW